MAIVQQLSALAVRQLIGGICQAAGLEAGPAVVEPVQSGLSHRFERFIGGLFTLCLIITVPLAIWNISTIPHGGEIPLLVGWFIGYCAAISGIPAVLAAIVWFLDLGLRRLRILKRAEGVSYRFYFSVAWVIVNGLVLYGRA